MKISHQEFNIHYVNNIKFKCCLCGECDYMDRCGECHKAKENFEEKYEEY